MERGATASITLALWEMLFWGPIPKTLGKVIQWAAQSYLGLQQAGWLAYAAS